MGGSVTSSRQEYEGRKLSARVLELRLAGLSFQKLADELGIQKRSAVRAYSRALKEITLEPATDVIKLELERLDAIIYAQWDNVIAGDVAAARIVIVAMERRAKYLGLDRPIEVNVRQIVASVAAELALTQDELLAVEQDVNNFLASVRAGG